MHSRRDHRWQRILDCAPPELLRQLAKRQEGHSLKKLYEDKETLVEEVFRICRQETIQALYEEFPAPENYTIWSFHPDRQLSKSKLDALLREKVTDDLSAGVTPELREEPQLYRIEHSPGKFIFRYAATDRKQTVAVSFGERTTISLVSYYSALLHYSEVGVLVFGPHASSKAESVLRELESFLESGARWKVLKPGRDGSRVFYNSMKKKLGADLIETKRHDPKGDYRTITLQARDRKPDLEEVPNFRKNYLDADSYYDVLEFECTNRFGLRETTSVKFGYPLGRFTAKSGTSLSAILYFENNVSELLWQS